MNCIKELWSYSSKLLLSSTITVVFNNIYVFFICKIYPINDTRYYTQANKYSELSYNTIALSIQAVLYPAMASIGAHDSEALKKVMRKTVRVTAFVILPIMLGLIATAEPLIHTLLNTKWLPIVPYFMILCVGYLFLGMTISYNNILFIKGLSSIFLRFNIVYRAVILLSIIFTMHSGIRDMLIAWSIIAVLYAITLMIYAGKKINYTWKEQLKDILPYFALAFLMGAGVFLFTFWIKNRAVLLAVQVIAGAIFYLGATYLLGSKVFRDAIEMVKSKMVR
jgi:O-antigen/teichoic acid export membrane protein